VDSVRVAFDEPVYRFHSSARPPFGMAWVTGIE